MIGDKFQGLIGALVKIHPSALYQRCTVHFYCNVFGKAPKQKRKEVARMLSAIHAQESFEASVEKAKNVARDLKEMKLTVAAKIVEDGYLETLTYTHFPQEHWRYIRTNNTIERINKEIRRRTKVVAHFPMESRR
jgi:putative transposase